MQRSWTKSIVTLFAVAIVTLVALLFAVFLPADSTPAYAAEPVEGTTTTEQVSDASGVMDADALKAAVENGGEVVLGSDITADVVIPEGKTVTINLNGHTLTNDGDHTIINYGTLTVEDSSTGEPGKVDNVTHGKAAIYNEVGATFTLASGTLDRTKEAGTSSSSSGDNSYYTLLNHGTAYINGGTIQQGGLEVGKYSSLVENGWYDGSKNTEKKPSIMTVNGGTFLGGLNSIKNDDYGELNIIYATVKNVAQAALLNWNVATIKGGSFSTDGGSAVILNGYINDTMDKGELTITGGEFTTNGGDFPLIARMDGSKPTGGVITVTVTSTNADLVAAAINVPGVTTYVKEGDAVTEMSVSDLAGLKEALNTETVKKITLACDITSDESLFFERDVTLDMNGYELTVAKTTTYEQNGKTYTYHPVVIDKANVTIVNGNITVGKGVYANLNAILVTNRATLTLGTKSDETVVEDDRVFMTTNSGYGIVVSGGAALNMYGGSVTAKWSALGTNNTTGTAAFNVYGATLESTDDSAIFMSCYTEVALKNTTVKGKTAIDIRIGKLTVEGGSITSTRESYHEMTYTEATATGTMTGGDGSAILVKANYYYDNANKSNEVSISISSETTITGAVTIYDLDGVGNMLDGKENVTDQTVNLQTFVDELKTSHASVETHLYDVAPADGSGDGTIVDVDKVHADAGEQVTAIVSSSDELRAALAEDNYDTVKLGADIQCISKVFVIDRPVTLDLADNILSTTSGYVLEITSSNVTVTGSVLSGEHTNTNTQIRGTIGIHINGTGVADGIKDIRIENIRIYTTSTVKSSCSVNIESADYVTLDNVTIRSSADCVRAWKGSENVTVTNSDLTTDGENDPNAIELLSNSSMTVTDSKITANGYGGAGIFIGTDDGGSSDNVAARLKVDGTTIISADAFGITGNGTQHGTYIEITDNAVITCTNFAVYHPQKGELKISGNAKITGASGIEMRAGTLIVTGTPTVTATDETYDESPLNDGPRFAGVALGVSRYFAGSENGVTLDIRGGTFKAKDGGYAFCEKDIAVTDAEDNRDLSFDGATFEGRLSSQNETGFIKSGTFTKGVELDYIEAGRQVGVTSSGGMDVATTLEGEGYDAIYTVSEGGSTATAIVNTADMFKDALANEYVTAIELGASFGGTHTIDRDMTISAAEGVTFSGNIVIESSSVTRTTGPNVKLEGVAFKGNGSGTAISVKNGSLTITGGSIKDYDNGIVAGTRGGAAVDISVDNVEFTELDEKGIYGEAFGDLTVKNSTFNGADNDASGAGNPYTGRSAAAIDINQTVAGGSVSITGNTFVDCGDNGSTSGAIKIKVRDISVEQSYGQAGDFAAGSTYVGSFNDEDGDPVTVSKNTFKNCSRDIVVGTGYVADTYVEVVLGEGENANTSYVSSADDAATRDLIFVDNAHVDDAESLMNAFADEDLVLIEVFADITTTDIIVVDKPGKSVVLDLNGYTITANDTTTSTTENGVSIGAGFLYLADGTLTVKDGTVNAIEDSFRVQTEATDDYAKLILADDLTVTSQNANAVYIRALNQQESTTPNAVLETAADLKVSGKYAAIQGNGTSTDGPVSVTVTGGDIVADPADETIDGTGLYLPGRGEYLITGGTITAPTGVEFRAGTLTITGGTITATGEFAADPNGNGATTSGVAVAMMQHTTERDLTLNITGGEFNGAYAVYQQNIQNNDSGTLTMSLSGGTFNGNVDSENCTEYISGGQYSVKPAAEAFKPGFDGVEYDGYYVVIETTTDDIAALLAARIDAQADVRTYAAVLGIDWKAMEALADTDDVAAAALDAYNAIGNATSEGYVAIARSAAMDALDAYAAAMAESDALASAITDAQKEVREYAAARGYAWADIADTAVLDAYNAIASVQAVDGVDDAKADAISAVREYLDGLESSGAESELEAAKLKAQTTVKMYIASADIGGWTNLLLIKQNGERVEKDAVAPIFAMYDMIEESTTVADIDAYMWKAISQVDTYVNALENWRKAAADEVTAAAQETAENANDAVVVPTSVYAAINGAVNYTEVNAYKTNALAEIADIRAYRADIAEQGSELDLIYGTLTEFKKAFDALDTSLTGENNAFDTLLKDVQDAITTAQNAITGGTDESSESLASIKSYLENTIYKAMTDFKADVDKAFGDLGSDLAAYGDVLIALRDALVGDGTDGSVGKIDEILADIADAQSDITNIKTTVGSLATTEDLTTAVTDIKGALTVSEGKITSAITAAQNAITSAIASVRTDIDALETALAGYESDFEGLSGTLAQINSSLGGKIDAAQADIDAIKTAIDALGTPASAAAVTELATAIDELKAAVNEISVSVSAPSAVETVKTEATADIAEWLNAYVDEIVNSVTASNGKAYAAAVTFAPALETTDGDLYAKLLKAFDKDNADLVLKYYNDALTAIDAATTADEVNTAVATFKAQVASVEAASGNTSDLTVVYVLLIVVLVVLVVAVVVAAVLSRKRRVPVGYAPAPTPAPAPATSETTEQTEKAALAEKPEVTDDTAATAVEPDEAPDEDAGERVVINASVKTFDEAYDEMSDTLKDMFEKVREYALSKNGATGVRIGNGVRVKRGSKQIVKLTVRRGYPVAMFVLENEMLKDYRRTAGSSAKLKVPATELVLREPSDLDAAYMMVDLAVRQLDADVEAAKERRRELLRERRRQRREAMEAAKAAQAAQAEATTEQAEPAATEQNEAATPEQAVDEDKTE